MTDITDLSLGSLAMFDAHAVAAMFGISPRTVCRLAEVGRIGHHRVGRQLRFTADDVAIFLTHTRHDATEATR